MAYENFTFISFLYDYYSHFLVQSNWYPTPCTAFFIVIITRRIYRNFMLKAEETVKQKQVVF